MKAGSSGSRTVLVLARDPGPASALVPIAASAGAHVIASATAAAVFARNDVRTHRLPDNTDPRELLASLAPDVLITGTEGAVRDGAWWDAAREQGVPTLALVDHWAHYLERFTVLQPFDRLPDRIAVMDVRAYTDLVNLGCPAERLVVTGQPAFDILLDAPPAGRLRTRRAWGVAEPERAILFASEPISGEPSRSEEAIALTMFRDATESLPARVFVRPHPRQPVAELASAFPGICIDATPDPRAAIAGADTVVGIGSVFLLEAALGGVPVLSIQPWFHTYPVPGGCPSLVASVHTARDARAWLNDPGSQRHLKSRERQERNRACGFIPGATARVLAEVDFMLRSRGA